MKSKKTLGILNGTLMFWTTQFWNYSSRSDHETGVYYIECGFPGCDAVRLCRWLLTFGGTFLTAYKTTQHYNSQDHD